MSTTKIDAPTRRSLTRRSMSESASNVSGSGRRSIFGKRRSVAASRAPRANRAPAPRCGRSRRPRFGHRVRRAARRGRAAGRRAVRRLHRHRDLAPRPSPPAPQPLRPRSPSVGTHHQASMQSRNSAATPAASLSAKIPHTARVRPPRSGGRVNCAPARAPRPDCAPHPISTWARRAGRSNHLEARGQPHPLESQRHRRGGDRQTRIDLLEGGDGRRRIGVLGVADERGRGQMRQIPAAAAVVPGGALANCSCTRNPSA